jgi:hypothetical protein
VSTSPDEFKFALDDRHGAATDIEAVAEDLLDLVDEFESAIRVGEAPPLFAERLARLRQTAERLIDP